MKNQLTILVCLFGFSVLTFMTGCESSNDPSGSSVIQGSVDYFETSSTAKQLLSAKAAGAGMRIRQGVSVCLEGPVNRDMTTGADGVFIFSDLPAGNYALRFEYGGEQARYGYDNANGNTLRLEEQEQLHLNAVAISQACVNVGSTQRNAVRAGQ